MYNGRDWELGRGGLHEIKGRIVGIRYWIFSAMIKFGGPSTLNGREIKSSNS